MRAEALRYVRDSAGRGMNREVWLKRRPFCEGVRVHITTPRIEYEFDDNSFFDRSKENAVTAQTTVIADDRVPLQ